MLLVVLLNIKGRTCWWRKEAMLVLLTRDFIIVWCYSNWSEIYVYL